MEEKKKYYAFLDIVIDVFYSIILYNAFISFAGFNIESLLMLISIFVMINYWWASRSYTKLPKYYLFDFYFITIIMFIFSQWPQYYSSIRGFVYVFAVFFLIDSVYSLLSIYVHKEKDDEPSLKFYFIFEIILALFYFLSSIFVNSVSLVSLAVIYLPYIIFYAVSIKKGFFLTRFINSGTQPY